MANMTKKGALAVTSALDNIASLFQQDFATLGVPLHIAKDFAYRCDLLADRVERTAGLKREALTELDVNKEQGYNPEEIGEEVGGPLEGDGDEPFMKGEFTQQENRELRERVQDGDLGMTTNLDPQNPTSGKQASARLASVCGQLITASGTIAHPAVRKAAVKLATDALASSGDVTRIARALQHVATVVAKTTDAKKLASVIALASQIVAKKAEEDEDEGEEEVPAKKAGKIPPQFLENVKKKQDEAKGKDDDDKDDDKKEDKKASHGFNLFG